MAKGSISQRPNGRWTVRWRLKNGTHRRKTFTSKKHAERYLRQAIVDVERGVFPEAQRGDTLGTLLDEWWVGIETTIRPRTLSRYRQHRDLLAERYGDVRAEDLDYDRVQRIVIDLADDYAARTVHAVYSVLALTIQHASLTGKIRPVTKPRLPKVEDPDLTIPTRDEVEALADVVDLRMRAMVILAGYAGLRQGELLGMERRNVRLTEQRVWVAHAVNKETQELEATKTKGSRRWVVLPQRAHAVLEWHLDEVATGERVFPLTASIADKSWKRATVAAGLPGIRFHDLRHAAASMQIAAGWNIMQVSRQLGHAKPSMTLNTYGFLYPESFGDALRKLDAYLDHETGP